MTPHTSRSQSCGAEATGEKTAVGVEANHGQTGFVEEAGQRVWSGGWVWSGG